MISKTRKVWLNADPETGMGVEPPMRNNRRWKLRLYKNNPWCYQQADVPVDLLKRYKEALNTLTEAQKELAKLFKRPE